MRTFFILILCFLTSLCTFAQTYEVGVSVGATNFVGDTGNTTFIRPTDVGFGVMAKWNRSKRHAFRFSALYLQLVLMIVNRMIIESSNVILILTIP